MPLRFALSATVVVALVVALVSAAERPAAGQGAQRRSASAAKSGSARPCEADVACCPAALKHFGRVGFPGPPPKLITRVQPDLAKVARPYPCGVVILELGIDLRGHVVSSCIGRGVRDDFDKAAQEATRTWRYATSDYQGGVAGIVMTLPVEAPNRSCRDR